mmetsp:Transcript_25426/g.44733  ORF Transcript_25426/g.44733 Transcript_25426/m.44733 type:complete len:222 (-) Transcript_25426:234-899(-)
MAFLANVPIYSMIISAAWLVCSPLKLVGNEEETVRAAGAAAAGAAYCIVDGAKWCSFRSLRLSSVGSVGLIDNTQGWLGTLVNASNFFLSVAEDISVSFASEAASTSAAVSPGPEDSSGSSAFKREGRAVIRAIDFVAAGLPPPEAATVDLEDTGGVGVVVFVLSRRSSSFLVSSEGFALEGRTFLLYLSCTLFVVAVVAASFLPQVFFASSFPLFSFGTI